MEITTCLRADTELREPDWFDQEGVARLTSKLDPELVVGDVSSTRNNCSSNNRRRRGKTPLLVAVDNAQSRRASKIRATSGHIACVQRSSGCECKEGKGESGNGRRHYDEEGRSRFIG